MKKAVKATPKVIPKIDTKSVSNESELSELSSEAVIHVATPSKAVKAKKQSVTKNDGGSQVKPKVKAGATSTPRSVSNAKGTPKSKATPKSAVVAAAKTKKVKGTPSGFSAKKVTGKEKSKVKGDAKTDQPRPRPVKKPVIIDPPAFEKVDTKLSLDEVEQRIMVWP